MRLLPANCLLAGVTIWNPAGLKTLKSGTALGAYGNHSATLWKRTESGEAELHKAKADLLIVQEGSATFVYGGTVVAPHATSAVEIRGTGIRDGQTRRLSPGDIVHVPAGTPHQFMLEKGQSVIYFALKIAR